MLRPAYLFSSAILAVVAVMQLQVTAQEPDHAPTATLEQAATPSVHRLTMPAQTISQAMSTPTQPQPQPQPQRWVF